jgi:hypothetical protein
MLDACIVLYFFYTIKLIEATIWKTCVTLTVAG